MATTRKRSSEQQGASVKKAKTEANGTNSVEVGGTIPDVTIPDQDGKPVSVRSITGVLVLFSYPKASTPGCTKQTRGFGEQYDEFKKLNATVYGLSADSEKAQTTFKNKLELPFNLLSDTKFELLGPLGAKKSPKGVIRSHWVFVDGKLVFAEHSVKPDASPLDTLEVAKQHSLESNGESEEANDKSEEANEAEETEDKVEETADEEAEETEQAKPEESNGDSKEQTKDEGEGEPTAEDVPEESEPKKTEEPEAESSEKVSEGTESEKPETGEKPEAEPETEPASDS